MCLPFPSSSYFFLALYYSTTALSDLTGAQHTHGATLILSFDGKRWEALHSSIAEGILVCV